MRRVSDTALVTEKAGSITMERKSPARWISHAHRAALCKGTVFDGGVRVSRARRLLGNDHAARVASNALDTVPSTGSSSVSIGVSVSIAILSPIEVLEQFAAGQENCLAVVRLVGGSRISFG